MQQEQTAVDVPFLLTKEYEALLTKAENGDDSAMICLSRHLQDGAIVDFDLERAKIWRRRAEEKGNEIAKIMKFYHGWDNEVNLEHASKLLISYIENQNNHEREDIFVAFHMMSFLYSEGIGTEKDYQKSLELCQRAADKNYPAAINNLAIIYQYGEGLNIDIAKALELYQKAANLGHSASFYNLGLIWEYGRAGEINIDRAIQYYEKSASKNNIKALNALARIYTTKNDKDKLLDCLVKASLLGCLDGKKKLIRHLQDVKTEWDPEFHTFWVIAAQTKFCQEVALNSQILTLFLVSKNRSKASFKHTHVMVKGITLKIIKFLCHLYL